MSKVVSVWCEDFFRFLLFFAFLSHIYEITKDYEVKYSKNYECSDLFLGFLQKPLKKFKFFLKNFVDSGKQSSTAPANLHTPCQTRKFSRDIKNSSACL